MKGKYQVFQVLKPSSVPRPGALLVQGVTGVLHMHAEDPAHSTLTLDTKLIHNTRNIASGEMLLTHTLRVLDTDTQLIQTLRYNSLYSQL